MNRQSGHLWRKEVVFGQIVCFLLREVVFAEICHLCYVMSPLLCDDSFAMRCHLCYVIYSLLCDVTFAK